MSITKAQPLPTSTPSGETAILPSRLLGPLPVPRDQLFSAPTGLYGFEECTTWALVPAGRDSLWWLQSADREELVFLLADPFAFFPGYEVDVPPAELAQIGATEDATLMALVIVTLPAKPGEAPSANLRAPLVVDAARRVLRQLVMTDESLSLTATIGL
jgi:flagellar assembly factor FliW